MSKIKMCAVLAVGLFVVGCGDDSYNCDNDAATIEAIKLEAYDKMYNKFDPRLDKIIDDSMSLIKINSREIVNINDKTKRSTCKAKYTLENPKNENEFKIMARVVLVMEKIFKTNGMFLSIKDQNMKNDIFKEIESDLQRRKDELSKSIYDNPDTGQETIIYDVYDNGRGDSFVEVAQ